MQLDRHPPLAEGDATASADGLLKKRGELGQHLIQDRGGNALQFAGATGSKVDWTWLIAADCACCSRSGSCQRDGESSNARKRTARCDRHYDWSASKLVEAVWRDDEDRSGALLLVAETGVERNEVDIAAFHNSRPTGGRLIQMRSSSDTSMGLE